MSNNSGIKQDSKELVKLWEIIQKNPEIGIPKKTEKVSYVYTDYMDKINDYQKKRLAINPDLKKYNFTNYIKIQHLLNKKPYKGSFYYDVLTGLAIAGGFTDWDDYMQKEWPNEYNELLSNPEDREPPVFFDINVCRNISKIPIGCDIIIGWYPKRYAKLRYMVDFKFQALEKNKQPYPADVFLYAEEFSVEMVEDIYNGYQMHPNIYAKYKGKLNFFDFDKKINRK